MASIATIAIAYLIFVLYSGESTDVIHERDTNKTEYITSTNDINKLKEFALNLSKSDTQYNLYQNFVNNFTLKISIGILLISLLLFFRAYTIKNKFLTNSSSETTNP